VTHLRNLMLAELQRRNYSQTTITGYLETVPDFAKYFHQSPDQLGPDEIRTYQLYLLNQRALWQCPRCDGSMLLLQRLTATELNLLERKIYVDSS
jgi:hypothetical protein